MIAQFEMNDERFRIIEAVADAIGFGTDTGAYSRTQVTYCGVSGALWNYGYGGRQIIWNPLTSTEDAVEVMLKLRLSWQQLAPETDAPSAPSNKEEYRNLEADFREKIVFAAIAKHNRQVKLTCP